MTKKYATVHIKEEAMRDGLQIEDKAIPASSRIRLLDAISDTGLKAIVIGSFVSPKYTPQMRDTEAVAAGFTPRPGVTYTALIPNEKGRERAAPYKDKIALDGARGPATTVHMCDVFTRRNWNRTQADEIARWSPQIEAAVEKGASAAVISINAAFGSNFTGKVSLERRMAMLTRQHDMWTAAGVAVTGCGFADPMSWCMPHEVEETIEAVRTRWPDIREWRLHVHNARGMAVPSIYAGLRVLTPDDSLYIETTLGGIGGCPYCGNGRATGMAPTEDVVNMLEEMGIETGVDLKKLIEAVWLLEDIIGRPSMGHVSKAGPFPRGADLYDPNIPFVETFAEARHFFEGSSVLAGQIKPWTTPIKRQSA